VRIHSESGARGEKARPRGSLNQHLVFFGENWVALDHSDDTILCHTVTKLARMELRGQRHLELGLVVTAIEKGPHEMDIETCMLALGLKCF